MGLLIGLDRFTKWFVLTYCPESCILNRGISWGMLNYNHPGLFIVLTVLIILITLALILYTYRRMQQGFFVWGELLIIAGSFSNIYDRLVYGGVVDFIEVRIGSWIGPSFNVADSIVVIGVAIMAYELFFPARRSENR